jgi:hypothetical protein
LDGGEWQRVGGKGLAAHTPFTYSTAEVSNTSDRPVTLESIELVDADGVRIVGLQAGIQRGCSAIQFPTFPPKGQCLADEVRALGGYVVPPQTERVALYVGIEATEIGQASFESLRLFYRVGDERYVEEVPAGFETSTREPPTDDAPR